MSSVNLQAINAYAKTNAPAEASFKQVNDNAVTFQKMMEANLATMSNINNAANISAAAAPSIIGVLKNSLLKQEKVSLDALTGEASTLDVVTASVEAKNTLDTITKLRNELQQALDKILNMSI
jgi:hypothetical protein